MWSHFFTLTEEYLLSLNASKTTVSKSIKQEVTCAVIFALTALPNLIRSPYFSANLGLVVVRSWEAWHRRTCFPLQASDPAPLRVSDFQRLVSNQSTSDIVFAVCQIRQHRWANISSMGVEAWTHPVKIILCVNLCATLIGYKFEKWLKHNFMLKNCFHNWP